MLTSLLLTFHIVKSRALLYSATIIIFSSCVEHRYYASPFNGIHSAYHPIPLKSDSVKSGYYAAVVISVGGANDQGVDDVVALHTSVSGAHNIGSFQTFYSLGFSAGNYKVDSADGVNHPGNKGFGGTGFEAGLNAVIPFAGGEWRILGIETSLHNEFGKYLKFRKSLPEGYDTEYDAIDLVVKNKLFATYGFYTEVIAHAQAMTFGLRIAAGPVIGRKYRNPLVYDEYTGRPLRYGYFNFTTHLTKNKYNGFMKVNVATKASSAQFGFNYRLGR